MESWNQRASPPDRPRSVPSYRWCKSQGRRLLSHNDQAERKEPTSYVQKSNPQRAWSVPEIDEVFAGSGDLAGALEEVARLGARLLLQVAVETELTEALGRSRDAKAVLTRRPSRACAMATAR